MVFNGGYHQCEPLQGDFNWQLQTTLSHLSLLPLTSLGPSEFSSDSISTVLLSYFHSSLYYATAHYLLQFII